MRARRSGLEADVASRSRKDSGAPISADDDATPVFRAVVALGARRGIRLEAIFWKTVSAMAAASGRTLGQEVGQALTSVPEDGNLASTLRVQAARWLASRVSELERITAAENVFAIIHASPTPAFVLSTDKKIVQYNQPFLNLIRSNLPAGETRDVARATRLSLDTQLEQVIELLKNNPKTPVATGFALGIAERRKRGQLRLVLAPIAASTLVIAYITQL
jgi:predicted DNA-binding ribbon-helix-helix protein